MLFHYLKNIRKYLIQNGFTKNVNKAKYDYIIQNCYKLPFIEDINKNICKEINKIFKKKGDYFKFNKYFTSTWSCYFKNGALCLKNVNIKICTHNSLENFNRRFKNLFFNKSKIENINYVDNLISIALDNKDFYINEINKKSKNISKNKLKLIHKENTNDISKEELSLIINEIESFEDIFTEINVSNKNNIK